MKSYQQFLAELKRRHVFKVAAIYGAMAFAILQVADPLATALSLPDSFLSLVVGLLLLGFPVALVLAWAFEVTPEGVQKAEPAAPGEIEAIVAQPASKRWVSGLLALAGIVALVLGSAWVGRQTASGPELNLDVTDAMAANVERIAVLPFANVGGESNEDVLAAGLQYDLQQNLGQLQALRVISPESVREYRQSSKGDGEIGDELGVEYILRGSVLRAGDRVQVNAQLIDAGTTDNLWSDQFEELLTPQNLFDIQSRIAIEIARQLATELSPADLAMLDEEPSSENLAALAAYNRAREPGLEPLMALRHAERAVELDPDFLDAWALAARLRSIDAWIGGGDKDRALAAVHSAESLAPESGEAVAARAFYTYYVEQDFEQASVQLRRALTRAPSDVAVAEAIADLHRRYGEWDQAVSAYRRAVQIDPRNPDMLTNYSYALEAVGQLAAADEVAEKALQVAPSVPSVRGRKVETTFLRYGDVRQARNLAAELGLSPGEHEEVRRLVMLAAYDGDWDEASRLTNQEARQEFPFFELGRLLRRGWVESLRGTDTKAVGDSILRLDFESTAGGIGDLADFAAYIYKNDVENAWAFLEEAEGNARAAGELVVLEIALNFATQTKARLGRTEEALEALEGMIDQPGFGPKLANLLHDPTWDALRGDPRFDDIIERRRAFEERANHDAEADRPWLP